MIKQRVIAVGAVFVILFVLSKSGVLDALLIFLLVGAIPGTSWSLSAGLMLTIGVVTVLLISFRYTAIALIDELDLRRRTQKYITRKERMPKKRFRSLTR